MFLVFWTERVQKPRLPGGRDAEHLQQQAVGDLWTLAALQREHVLLRGGEGDLCPQAHELPWTLVRVQALLGGFSCSVGLVWHLMGGEGIEKEKK